MRSITIAACLGAGILSFSLRHDDLARAQPAAAVAGKSDSKGSDAKEPFGISKRVPWTTSKFRGTPDPPLPYRAERIFPKLHFDKPTVLTNAPATDRLFVAEQFGKIFSIPNDPNAQAADPFLDATALVPRIAAERKEDLAFEAVYGLAFHPQFAQNRYCYVCYVVRYRDGKLGQHPAGTRVSRFTVNRSDPPHCDPASEKLIIDWLQGGHNGGCLKFGPEVFCIFRRATAARPFLPTPSNRDRT